MMTVTFTVPGSPRGKGRPRFARRGNFVKTYTDAKTASYEDQIRFYALQAMGSSEPLETAVSVFIYIRCPIPASYSNKRKLACIEQEERPTKRPDIDNNIKIFLDGMNGIVYVDDAQVVTIHATKVYSTQSGVDLLVKEELL